MSGTSPLGAGEAPARFSQRDICFVETPTVSVVVVSRGRADALRTCLDGLSRLFYGAYEIIVVTDPVGQEAVQQSGLASHLKLIAYDQPNISAARNLGIAAAAGQVVAFIDDDAVPEPTWLHHLTAPFSNPEVAVTGGFVRGRNGISYQWRAQTVDRQGRAYPLQLSEDATGITVPPPGHVVKTEGTNMAVRRDWLLRLGGFDEAFHFYLDETDLNIRIADAGGKTALTPLAEVHHAYAPSPRRRQNRAVTDLFDVGASTALFLRKHDSSSDPTPMLMALRQDQWDRLNRQVRRKLIRRSDMAEVLKSLDAGWQTGTKRVACKYLSSSDKNEHFQRFDSLSSGVHLVISGWIWSRKHLLHQAVAAGRAGQVVSLYVFSPTRRAHRLGYQGNGIWLQRGGLFGRSNRCQKFVQWWRFGSRLAAEVLRVEKKRQIS